MNAAMKEVQAALEATTPMESVLALARAWCVLPSKRIARVCRELSASLKDEAVDGANQAAREEAWLSIAGKRDPRDLGRLLLTLWSRNAKDARRRLEALRGFGPDPRVVGALLELDTGERYLTAEGNRFWEEAYELMLEWGAPEAVARIPNSSTAADVTSPLGLVRYQAVFEPLVERWRSKWPREPELPVELSALLDRLDARVAPRRGLLEGLLRAVHDSPGDENPRLVLADALAEQGDPRGEFISLQLSHAGGGLTMGLREKMARLANASANGWLDGLDRQVSPIVVFHRGFASEVRLATREPDATLRAWRLIETIDLGGLAFSVSRFVAHENLKALHSLRGVSSATLAELARNGAGRTWKLIELEALGGDPVRRPAWSVDRLRINGFVDQSMWWFTRSGLAEQTATPEFALTLGFGRVGPAVAALWDQTSSRAVEFTAMPDSWPAPLHGRWTLRFERTRPRTPAQLLITVNADEPGEALEDALRSLLPGVVDSVRVVTHLKRSAEWRESLMQQLRTWLEVQKLKSVPTLEPTLAPPPPPPLIWR